MTVKIVDGRISVAGDGAPPVISGDIANDHRQEPSTARPSKPTHAATPPSGVSGSTDGKSASGFGSPISKPLVTPSVGSNKRWRQPRSVREFAAQVNAMATAVLNGEVEGDALEAARLYANLARTVAQSMTTEVQRARFLGRAPDLNFEIAECTEQEPEVEAGIIREFLASPEAERLLAEALRATGTDPALRYDEWSRAILAAMREGMK